MFLKKNYKNSYSSIHPQFFINQTTGLILICGYHDSRLIYIETNNELNERVITRYSITFSTGMFGNFNCDEVARWQRSINGNSEEVISHINKIKKDSHTVIGYQVDKKDIEKFIKCMEIERDQELILNGDQDSDINDVLERIGRSPIQFPKNHNYCSIF